MLLRNITHNLSFADAQLLAKIRLKIILNSVNNATFPRSGMTMMSKQRANSDIKHFVLRKSKETISTSERAIWFPIGFRGLRKAYRGSQHLPATSPTVRRQTYSDRITNNPRKSSAAILKTMKRFTKIVNDSGYGRIPAAIAKPPLSFLPRLTALSLSLWRRRWAMFIAEVDRLLSEPTSTN
jgi:hypothetical protein